jgi:hypothetical protein
MAKQESKKMANMPSKGVKKLATTPNVSERMGKDPGKMVMDAPRNRMAAFYSRRAADRIENDKETGKSFSPNEALKLRSFADSLSREADADEKAYKTYKKLTTKREVPKMETTTKKKK